MRYITKIVDSTGYSYDFAHYYEGYFRDLILTVYDISTHTSSELAINTLEDARRHTDIAGGHSDGRNDYTFFRADLPETSDIVRAASKHIQMLSVDANAVDPDAIIDILDLDYRLVISNIYKVITDTDVFLCYGNRGIPVVDILRYYDSRFDIYNDSCILIGVGHADKVFKIPITTDFRRDYIKYKSLVRDTRLDRYVNG
jgi:hypothetical protein